MLLVTFAAAVLAVTQPATPVGTSATLSTPREVALTLDGHVWRCDAAGQCVGRGGGGVTQPLMRECRRFVARVGAVSAYARNDLALTEAEVAQCNAAVRP
ncbi:CC_3452 family protein [Brevundimonas sp.]|uniref:CC_3452 family protein n=1 Tax=Brevundimonas sp. TaxID=1871086 RepID=UPI003D115005